MKFPCLFRMVLAAFMFSNTALLAEEPPKAASPEKKAAVFSIAGCGHELATSLQKDGFAVNVLPYPGLEGPALTWDRIKAYNVIVLAGLGRSNADYTLPDKTKGNIELLHKFLNEGGGILFIPHWGQMRTLVPPQDAFSKPLGLTALFEEVVFDPETSVRATSWKIDFANTGSFSKTSPITANVTSLWYPVATRAGAQQHTTTFVADKEWEIVGKGSKTSCARHIGFEDSFELAKEGHYASEVPLVASRTVGKGRIVCLGITPEYLFHGTGLTTLERIVFDRGLKNVPSGGYALVRNALRWLAEPSLKEGTLGGAAMDPALLENPSKTKFGAPLDWKKIEFHPTPLPAHVGVIGARSALSSGKGTVEEWVKQAREQKLAYLVFLEEFAKLPPEKFEELKKECARLTTPDFAAIPGFTIDDEIGNHYFYFATTLPYPEKKFLSKDGTVFVAHDPELGPKDPSVKGQLAMTALLYSYSVCSFKLTAGNYLFSQDAAPFANFFSDWDAVGVVTARDGKLVEDALKDYLKLVNFGQGPLPLAISFVTSPSHLEKCRWKTVLRLAPSGASAVGDTLEGANKIAAYWNEWHFYPDIPTRIYMTSGPEIEIWTMGGARDYGGNNAGEFVWQNYRRKVYGKVKSEVGLKEVLVYDGEKLFRRFLPTDQKEFEFTLDLAGDKQQYLVLVATDLKGGRAVSGDQWNRNHRMEECQCSDRNNQLSYGYHTNKDGIGMVLGGNQTLASPNKRIDDKFVSPSGTFKNDGLLGAPAFDGGTGGEPAVFAPMMMRLEKGAINPPSVSESFRLLHTGDVNIGEGRWEHNFTDDIRVANVWHTLWKTEPAKDFTGRKRNVFFNVDPDSPLAVFLWTIQVDLKRDLPNNGMLAGFIRMDEAKFWAIRGSNQAFYAGNWESTARSNPRYLSVPFDQGAYAAALDSPLGGAAVFPMTDGMAASLGLPTRGNINFDLPAAQVPRKKGQTKEVSFLILGIPRATDFTRQFPSPTTEVVEKFYRDFGLDGGKCGYTVEAQQGTILGQRYILDVNGKEAGGFSGTLSGNLISSLPITVSNLADRWSAYLYDRGLKKARPIGVFENKAWAIVRLHGSLDVFVGHPITCDQLELFIQVTQTDENGWNVEVHNPTEKPIRARLQKNPSFDPFQDKELKDPEFEIPAGQSITWSL